MLKILLNVIINGVFVVSSAHALSRWTLHVSRELQQTFRFFRPTTQPGLGRRPLAPVPRGLGFDSRVRDREVVIAGVPQPFERQKQRFFAQRRRAAWLVHRFLRRALFAAVHQHFVATAKTPVEISSATECAYNGLQVT